MWSFSLQTYLKTTGRSETWGHVNVHGLCCHQIPRWCPWSGLPQGPCWCLWSLLSPKAMLTSIIFAEAGGCVDVWSLCWGCRPWWGLWSMLSPGTMLRSIFCVAARGYVDVCGPCSCRKAHDYCCCWLLWMGKLLLQWHKWLQTHSCEWETSKTSATTPLPHPPKKRNSLDKKPLKRVLKKMW